jgi:hypothetical protein
MTDSREIRAVLDRSALESYARSHVHVGELITVVADEGRVGIPAVALLDAHARALGNERARALLNFLVTLEGVTVLKLGADEARELAGTVSLTGGDIPRAHAVWLANTRKAIFFTTEPDEVKFLVPPDNVLQIPAEDA